jgi:TetR/AcrR family transcriptional regulator, transcriptional repressor for nem operon
MSTRATARPESVMARPRGFQETVALDAAIDCFWQRGYRATSMRDLSVAMGIGSASLYSVFHDKHSLFVRALERYMDGATRVRIGRLESSMSPKAAIRRFVEEVIERSVNDPDRRGCFLINSALEVAPHDKELGIEIARRLGEIEDFFWRSVRAGQSDGTIPESCNSRDTARLLLGALLGIRVLARSKPDRALLEGIARPALALLD